MERKSSCLDPSELGIILVAERGLNSTSVRHMGKTLDHQREESSLTKTPDCFSILMGFGILEIESQTVPFLPFTSHPVQFAPSILGS